MRTFAPSFLLLLLSCVPMSVAQDAESTELASAVYFPVGSISEFQQSWYSSHLEAMEEPVLATTEDQDYFALRVTYLPTWGRPIAFRYEIGDGKATHRAVMLTGSGGYDPGGVRSEIVGSPPPDRMSELISALEVSGYWRLAAEDDVRGLDGSELIVETVRNGGYRVLVRWTPEHDTEERNLTGLLDFYTGEFTRVGLWGVY